MGAEARQDRVRSARPEATALDSLETLVHALPARRDRIRRRFWRDPEFRAVCEDYRDVIEALDRLARQQAPHPGPAAELRDLAADLLAEAEQMLRGEQE